MSLLSSRSPRANQCAFICDRDKTHGRLLWSCVYFLRRMSLNRRIFLSLSREGKAMQRERERERKTRATNQSVAAF